MKPHKWQEFLPIWHQNTNFSNIRRTHETWTPIGGGSSNRRTGAAQAACHLKKEDRVIFEHVVNHSAPRHSSRTRPHCWPSIAPQFTWLASMPTPLVMGTMAATTELDRECAAISEPSHQDAVDSIPRAMTHDRPIDTATCRQMMRRTRTDAGGGWISERKIVGRAYVQYALEDGL